MNKDFSTKQILNSNLKWFDFYLSLPVFITIFLGIAFFIFGIVIAATNSGNPAIAGIVIGIWVGGAIVCAFAYVVLKIVTSHKILQIYYLKALVAFAEGSLKQKKSSTQIKNKNNKSTTSNNQKREETDEFDTQTINSNIQKIWEKMDIDEDDDVNTPNDDECPMCFAKITPEDAECPNCGYKLK